MDGSNYKLNGFIYYNKEVNKVDVLLEEAN